MKKLLLSLMVFCATFLYGQDYQLLPDSCTFCMYLVSTGGNSWNNGYYQLDPNIDTVFSGNTYMKMSFGTWGSGPSEQPFAFRQNGNKLMGIVHDSINEFLLMDFDAQVGDTIYNLYSEGLFYNAKVLAKDSILVNGEVYHRFMNLEGLGYYQQGIWQNVTWGITWNEKALCGRKPNSVGWGTFRWRCIQYSV
ncbi:MAG: hypothetical protein JKY09_07430 [Crocinitomicaceae bacterium]|nr:hypothetical protein [Crocinitomicaceae bacterium]